jgi:alpha-galactosidase
VRRVETPDDTAWLHGVVAADGSAALMSYVQLAPPPHDRPVALRVPGLDPGRRYLITDVTPGPPGERASAGPGRRDRPVPPGLEVPGAVLAGAGVDLPVLAPLTAAVLHIEAL